MRTFVIATVLLTASVAGAQTVSRPTPRPEATAAGTAWYASREPIFVLGNYYFPAGATRFFDANTMVPADWFDGIPIYQNTTLEPNSIVFVPVGRGMVQPYELLRAGDLAGTTGSLPPSFPVETEAEATPTPVGVAAIGRTVYRSVVPQPTDMLETPVAVGTYGRAAYVEPEPRVEPPPSYLRRMGVTRSVRLPEYQSAVWVQYDGARWFSAGKAVPFDEAAFQQVGEYDHTPVYRLKGGDAKIYLPVANGRVAPYERR